ncbi:MAG: toxin PIN [Prevotella sp.]|uniref:toxin PIN n=1 Tax=Prevotella sp. TaxID=59823 RepID=UPI002A3441A3|nr:toxin PIN [Prevotella sp.]MDD7317264.1 toxin PIN [Prevotellaceae bacterium]MDY4019868.1 toxin PIN [Prevotella sp.]
MKKKIYLSPGLNVKTVETEGIMTGGGSGNGTGISEEPATEPAHGKGNSFFTSDESSSFGSSSPWDDSEE